jgi:hypothetical protein
MNKKLNKNRIEKVKGGLEFPKSPPPPPTLVPNFPPWFVFSQTKNK